MTVAAERLMGCTAATLDSYLRGVGLLLLAGRIEPELRAWWGQDAVMRVAAPEDLDEVAARVAEAVRNESEPILTPAATPWRGAAGRGLAFEALRNQADDHALGWFDACAVPRPETDGTEDGRRSDRENNPLLGQGGGFGRSELAPAQDAAISRLRKESREEAVRLGLVALLRAEATTGAAARLTISNKVLGAYQSGRGTGPGASARDTEPSQQPAATPAWDVLLIIEALAGFRGSLAGRARSDAPARGAFPFLVRARRAGSGAATTDDDDRDTYEFLAPLWAAPARADVIQAALRRARLRARSAVAGDVIEGALIQAARGAGALGFGRLVRFAFVAPSDPRYRFAQNRGTLTEARSPVAVAALEEILTLSRALHRLKDDHVPAATRLARRILDDALVALAEPGAGALPGARAQAAQRVLSAVAGAGIAAATLGEAREPERTRVRPPALSGRWWSLSADGEPATRIAKALASAWRLGSDGWLREWLRPETRDATTGRWRFDPNRDVPALDRVHDPLAALGTACLRALRALSEEAQARPARLFPRDLAWLIGVRDPEAARRVAILTAAFSALPASSERPVSRSPDGEAIVLGTDVARLLAAAAPAPGESEGDARPRRVVLMELVLRGSIAEARALALREVASRRTALLPPAPLAAPPPAPPAALALCICLPLPQDTVAAVLAPAISDPTTKGRP